jgi:hypothetical protein
MKQNKQNFSKLSNDFDFKTKIDHIKAPSIKNYGFLLEKLNSRRFEQLVYSSVL